MALMDAEAAVGSGHCLLSSGNIFSSCCCMIPAGNPICMLQSYMCQMANSQTESSLQRFLTSHQTHRCPERSAEDRAADTLRGRPAQQRERCASRQTSMHGVEKVLFLAYNAAQRLHGVKYGCKAADLQPAPATIKSGRINAQNARNTWRA